MGKALLLIFQPLLMKMAFSLAKYLLKAALGAVDIWMKKKVASTDNKYDDQAYLVFKDNKDGIIDALDRVIDLITGK
jgi:hypothetical protein